MKDDYYENTDATSQQFEEVKSIVEIYPNQFTSAIASDESIDMDEDRDYNEANPHKLLSSVCSDSIVNTQDHSPVNNLMETDDLSGFPFDHREWLILDSLSGRHRRPRQYEFLYLLLEKPRYSSYVSWLNENEGIFKIDQPERVAALWKKVKKRQTNGDMDYNTFARGIRFYYKCGSMIKTNRKYTFRFRLPIDNTP